jgi:hypothetical protein
MVDRETRRAFGLKAFLREIFNLLQLEAEPLSWSKPLVIMIIGVNGNKPLPGKLG